MSFLRDAAANRLYDELERGGMLTCFHCQNKEGNSRQIIPGQKERCRL
jgi:hypothetical protein